LARPTELHVEAGTAPPGRIGVLCPADRQHMTSPMAKLRLLGGVRLKADVDGMESVVAVDERSVRAAPNDVRSELFVQDVRVVLIVARLEPRSKLLGDPSGVRGIDSQSRAAGHR
jgi:hypothetical protein